MKNSERTATDIYVGTLGRLPDDGKAEFISQAIVWLEWMRTAQARARWQPSQAHHQALENVALQARELKLAMERVEKSGVPLEYLRDAWTVVVKIEGVDDPFPLSLPGTLSLLAMMARLWQPDPKPMGRPVENSPSTLLIRLLADRFRAAFGKAPTFGTDSPFVKFCNVALSDYGFSAPSIPTIKRIVGRETKSRR